MNEQKLKFDALSETNRQNNSHQLIQKIMKNVYIRQGSEEKLYCPPIQYKNLKVPVKIKKNKMSKFESYELGKAENRSK